MFIEKQEAEREWPTRLARLAVILGLVSIALTAFEVAMTIHRTTTGRPERPVYVAWMDMTSGGAFLTALSAAGLSLAAQVGPWRRSLPSRLGCLSFCVALLALILPLICLPALM